MSARELFPRPAPIAAYVNHRATLTPELVAAVLAMPDCTMRAVGRQLGLHHSMVSAIRAGKTWLQRAQAQAAE